MAGKFSLTCINQISNDCQYLKKMSFGHISGCHYLDGIPVKISERFRPPRKVSKIVKLVIQEIQFRPS